MHPMRCRRIPQPRRRHRVREMRPWQVAQSAVWGSTSISRGSSTATLAVPGSTAMLRPRRRSRRPHAVCASRVDSKAKRHKRRASTALLAHIVTVHLHCPPPRRRARSARKASSKTHLGSCSAPIVARANTEIPSSSAPPKLLLAIPVLRAATRICRARRNVCIVPWVNTAQLRTQILLRPLPALPARRVASRTCQAGRSA